MSITTIVTGNGFTNNAQRFDDAGGSILENQSYYLDSTSAYTFSFIYRTNAEFALVLDSGTYNINYMNILPINTSNPITKNLSFSNSDGYISYKFVTEYITYSETSNTIPTSHPTSLTFTIDTSPSATFPINYIISTGSTSGGTYVRFLTDEGEWIDGLATNYNYSTGEITISSFKNNSSGTFSGWHVYIYPYGSYSTTSITQPTSYPTQKTLITGKNLFFQQNQCVAFYYSLDATKSTYGIVDSYTPSTGSLTINCTYSENAGTYSNWYVSSYYLRTQSSTTITPSITGVTVTGYTATGLPSDIINSIINSGETGYSGYSNSTVYLQSLSATPQKYIQGKMQSYNSTTGYFSLYVINVYGSGSWSNWVIDYEYSGYWIEIDKVNLLQA